MRLILEKVNRVIRNIRVMLQIDFFKYSNTLRTHPIQ